VFGVFRPELRSGSGNGADRRFHETVNRSSCGANLTGSGAAIMHMNSMGKADHEERQILT
jgi:hypothetical protein